MRWTRGTRDRDEETSSFMKYSDAHVMPNRLCKIEEVCIIA